MLINELLTLREAAKSSIFDALKALKEGEKPDAKTIKASETMMTKAEKTMLKLVLDQPDNYGIDDYGMKASDIRNGTHIHTTHIGVHEKGLCFMMRIDTDDIGGDSDNAEDLYTDFAGKIVGDTMIGEQVVLLNAQDDFKREE